MLEPVNKAFVSPNFAFLMKYDGGLVRHAALAERYVFGAPNSALIKLRQFGELSAQHAAAYADTRLHIATAQGMIKRTLYPSDEAQPVPGEWYDCVIIDECHHGYKLDQEMSDAALQFRNESDDISKYRRVLDHFSEKPHLRKQNVIDGSDALGLT